MFNLRFDKRVVMIASDFSQVRLISNLSVELVKPSSPHTSSCYVSAVAVKVWLADRLFKIATHYVKMLRQ